MAHYDHERGHLRVRLAFAGAPHAGKTESVAALSREFRRPLVTPEETEDGRTLFFDWVEYEGGSYAGRPIVCQVVSVPGQPELLARRSHILDDCDGVVFVVDSTAGGLDASREALAECRDLLGRRDPPPPLLFAVNKRDLPDAHPLDEVLRVLGPPTPEHVVETVAASGDGVRKVFVFAMSDALEQVRRIDAERGLERLRSGDRDPGALFRELLGSEGGSVEDAEFVTVGTEGSAGAGRKEHPLGRPIETMSWPPVEAHVMLEDALTDTFEPDPSGHGYLGERWQARECPVQEGSRAAAGVERVRGTLVHWARHLSSHRSALAPERFLFAAEVGGDHRVWQVTRRFRSALDLLDDTRRRPPSVAGVEAFLQVWRTVADAERRLGDGRATLTIGLDALDPARGSEGPVAGWVSPAGEAFEAEELRQRVVDLWAGWAEEVDANELLGALAEAVPADRDERDFLRRAGEALSAGAARSSLPGSTRRTP